MKWRMKWYDYYAIYSMCPCLKCDLRQLGGRKHVERIGKGLINLNKANLSIREQFAAPDLLFSRQRWPNTLA